MDWNKLRNEFFEECTDPSPNSGRNAGIRPINMNAHNLFEWFKNKIETLDGDTQPSAESKCNKHDVNHRVCANCYHCFKGKSEIEYCGISGNKIKNKYKDTCNIYSTKIEWLHKHGG